MITNECGWAGRVTLLAVLALAGCSSGSNGETVSKVESAVDKGTKLTTMNSPMNANDVVLSPTGVCELTMEPTGDLVASAPGTWHTGTSGNNGGYASMLATGDLVIYDALGNRIKHSRTGQPGLYLGIDDGGNVHLYFPDGTIYLTNFTMYPFT